MSIARRLPAALLVLLATAVVTATGAGAAGLVKNGEFVTRAAGDEAWPADWTGEAAVHAAYAAVNDDGCTDKDALRYSLRAGQTAGAVTQPLALQKNTDYVLVAALKSDGTLKPVVRLSGEQGQLAMVVSDGTKTWKVFSARFNSGAAATATLELFGDAALAAHGPAVAGTSGIDGVQVYLPSEVPTAAAGAPSFVPPGPNLALHKPYTLQPAPSYGYSTDPEDKIQLTDGAYTVGYFWTQKTTVGWSGANPIIITLDLGAVEPIAGLSYDTAAGVAGVTWPNSILIMTSDDGRNWSLAGDLITLAAKAGGLPAPTPYSVHAFRTDALKTHGRYVKLFVDQVPYGFVDEIEVYRGPAALLQTPLTAMVDDPVKLFEDRIVYSGMIWRLRTDLDAARKAIAESALPGMAKAALQAKADALAPEIDALPTKLPRSFRTILPLNDVHARIYALYAPLQRARGLAPLTVWGNSRWDMLAPTEAPRSRQPLPALTVQMMQREHRGATVNLTNTTDRPMRVTVNVKGLPGGTNPQYVSLREVPFTDTRDRVPIADALPEARAGVTGYHVRIPAGMTRQLWLELYPLKVAPGTYRGEISLRSSGLPEQRVPLSLRLSPLVFPARPTIHVGGWDYLETPRGTYDAVPTNTADFLKILPANYVDTPWASASVQPTGQSFDAQGRLTSTLSFTNWDRWIALWPGARLYAVFLSVPDSFGGEAAGTPRFNRMVGDWFSAWAKHLEAQGLDPKQLVVLLSDEPHDDTGTQVIKPWAAAIKAAKVPITLFEDPTYDDPTAVKDGFWNDIDVVCPNLPMFLGGNQAFRDFYVAQRQAGRDLWFYSCSGPSKLLDPITYHRSQFWFAARYGAKGSFYWAFGDEAGGSSWNAYLQKRAQYSPLFVDPSGVTDAKHMAAIREGVQDYEYFVMLRARVAELEKKGVKSPLLQQASQLAVAGPQSVVEQINADNLTWAAPKDREMMDRVRVQVLTMLEKLNKL